MTIKKCSEQDDSTLEEFFEYNNAMLNLISELKNYASPVTVWGLTSLNRLCLLSDNDSRSPWYIIIFAKDPSSYVVEYLKHGEGRPLDESYAREEVNTLEAAVRLIQMAIKNTGGWST